MKPLTRTGPACWLLPVCLVLAGMPVAEDARAGGVTVITHGFNSDVNGWVTGMANVIPNYLRFPGTNFTIYKVTLTTDGAGNYFYQWSRTNGAAPASIDSGEIIVKLDWSQMAGGSTYDISTLTVASVAAQVLSLTNAISELGGHALAELPLHLIGHSRGGSLIAEMSRQLGTNGIWIDHLTSLDPHPLNNDGNFDPFFPTDATASNTYANVLFADDYWQNLGNNISVPNGEPVAGAYVRQLTNLSGGNSSSHSDVHLWYHGTIDWRTPTTDTEATITSAERQAWWVAYEQQGTNAGFEYSLIGGADRLGTNQPLGAGNPAIRDGFNQRWDFGAGTNNNRTALATNNGAWPSPIKLNRTDTNQIVQGQAVSLKLYYQWAKPGTSNATLSFYLDDDLNPFDNNQNLLGQITVPGSGTTVNFGTFAVALSPTNASPGSHWLFATLSAGGRTRYLYAPEPVQVLSNQQPPTLDIARLGPSQFRIGVNGLVSQTIILQSSTNLVNWQPLATNTLVANRWVYTNSPAAGTGRLFYRAMLGD
jgi:hypothetical protein